MNIRVLSPAIGAELTGLDLRHPLPTAALDAVHEAFSHHHLLLFRNQDIDPSQQKRFAEYFGPTVTTHQTRPEDGLMFISNTERGGAVGNGTLPFHSDHTFFEKPDTSALLLYALEVPSAGGETVWANTLRAYEDLSQSLKDRVAGLHAMHTYAKKDSGYRVLQPVARLLPDLGRSVLFVSQFCEDGIAELPGREGDELLSELFAQLYRKELLYKHKWSVGDLIVWDNRILQHARTDFDPAERRTLRRSTLGVPEAVVAAGR